MANTTGSYPASYKFFLLAPFVLFYVNPIKVSLRSVPDSFGAVLMMPSQQVAVEP